MTRKYWFLVLVVFAILTILFNLLFLYGDSSEKILNSEISAKINPSMGKQKESVKIRKPEVAVKTSSTAPKKIKNVLEGKTIEEMLEIYLSEILSEEKLCDQGKLDINDFCSFPIFSPFNKDLGKYFAYPPHEKFSEKEYYKFLETQDPLDYPLAKLPGYFNSSDNTLYISDYQRKNKLCSRLTVQQVFRVDDWRIRESEETEFSDSLKVIDTDVVKLNCYSKDNKKTVSYYNQHLYNSYPNPKRKSENSNSKTSELLNLVFIGFDSISKNSYTRQLLSTPHFQKTLRNIEDSENDIFVSTKLNTIGDGTIDNMLAFFTGDDLSHQPVKSDRKIPSSPTCSEYNWIWEDFESQNYVSHHIEDQPDDLGTWTWITNGLGNPVPINYYGRTFIQATKGEYFKADSNRANGVYVWNHMLDDVDSLFHLHQSNTLKKSQKKPIFSFLLIGYTHNQGWSLKPHSKYISKIFEKWYNIGDKNAVKKNGELRKTNGGAVFSDRNFDFGENTILFLYSDHGMRWNWKNEGFRNTFFGRIEERNPMVLIILPRKFKEFVKKVGNTRIYEKFLRNINNNMNNRLITHYDLYVTIRHIYYLNSLYLSGKKLKKFDDFEMEEKFGKYKSLFLPILETRSCENANIKKEFCLCCKLYLLRNPKTHGIVNEGIRKFLIEYNKKYLATSSVPDNIKNDDKKIKPDEDESFYCSNIISARIQEYPVSEMLAKTKLSRRVYIAKFEVSRKNRDIFETRIFEVPIVIHHSPILRNHRDFKSIKINNIEPIMDLLEECES